MSTIEKNVMAGVHVIYFLRTLTSRFALACYAFLFSLIGITMLVSVPHVVQNFVTVTRHGVGGISTFTLSAILDTKLSVQLVLCVGGIALCFMLSDLIRSFFNKNAAEKNLGYLN